MYTLIILTAMQSNTDDGLTWRGLIEQLPADPASVFTLLLATVAVVFVIWAGRSKGGGGKTA